MNVYVSEKMLPAFVRRRAGLFPGQATAIRYAGDAILSSILSKNLLSAIHKANSQLRRDPIKLARKEKGCSWTGNSGRMVVKSQTNPPNPRPKVDFASHLSANGQATLPMNQRLP
jgi:hypothetical protein